MAETDPDERLAAEPTIREARFHASSGRVFVDLSNGAIVAFPDGAIPALAGGSMHDLADIVVVDDGHVLHWPKLGVHVSYLSILTDVLGARSHMVRIAGSVVDKARERAERDGPPTRRKPRR